MHDSTESVYNEHPHDDCVDGIQYALKVFMSPKTINAIQYSTYRKIFCMLER